MAATNTVTITGVTGPAKAVTSLVLTDVLTVTYELDRRVIVIQRADGYKEYDYNSTVTVTHTISGVNTTITIV